MDRTISKIALAVVCYSSSVYFDVGTSTTTQELQTSRYANIQADDNLGFHWGLSTAHAEDNCDPENESTQCVEEIEIVGQPEPDPYIPPPVAPGNPGDQGDDGGNSSGGDTGGNNQPAEPTYTEQEIRECKDRADRDFDKCNINADKFKKQYNHYCTQFFEWYEETGDIAFKEEARQCQTDRDHNFEVDKQDCKDRWVWDRDYCDGLNNP